MGRERRNVLIEYALMRDARAAPKTDVLAIEGRLSLDIVKVTFDDFMKASGFVKKGGSWYSTSNDAVIVVELQKSQYGPKYYVNIAWWLRLLGNASAPKEHACHVRTRLARLAPVIHGVGVDGAAA